MTERWPFGFGLRFWLACRLLERRCRQYGRRDQLLVRLHKRATLRHDFNTHGLSLPILLNTETILVTFVIE
jgi:hypothetical protein